MKGEITDGMRHDLKMVLCTQKGCSERSNFPRCYIERYMFCHLFAEKPVQPESWRRIEVREEGGD